MGLRLVLVDDHALFRDLLREYLRGHDIEVVGEAGGGVDALSVLEVAHADVVLMDIALRGGDGIMATRELIRREPSTCVLMLSMHEDVHSIARALAAGACGYACKAQSGAEIIDAIHAVHRGETYLPPSVDRAAVERLRSTYARARQLGVLAPLSPRERDVFRLLVQGENNDTIAAMLQIAERTVEAHRAHILKRLHIHSLAALIRFAVQHQLLPS